jgi:hypothetical protein
MSVPGDAVYCPSCGALTGALRIESLDGDADNSSAEVGLGGPRRRWLAPLVIAVVVGLVAVVAAVGGRDQPAAAPTTTSSSPTTAPPATTSTLPSPTTATTSYSTFEAPPLPDAAGVVVYISTNIGEILRVDLGTGAVERRLAPNEPRRAGPWVVLGRRGGFAMADASYDDQSSIYGVLDGPDGPAVPIGDWQSTENQGSASPRAAAAAEPDEVWIWNDAVADLATIVKRVRLDGTVTAGPVTLPRYGTVLGDDGPGAVAVQSPGGFYRATIDGSTVSMERLWPRPPLVYSSGALLDLDCDDNLECHLQVVDRGTGAAHAVPGDLAGTVFPNFDSALSADGRWLATVNYDGTAGSPRLVVYDLTTGAVVLHDAGVLPTNYGTLGTPQSAEFSPDGRWLVYLDLTGDLRLWRVGSPQAAISFSVPGLENVSSASVAPG